MSETDKHTAEIKRARAQLDRAASELDEPSVMRLRAARKRVLAAADARRRWHSAWWLPLASAALAGLVAVAVVSDWWRAPPALPVVAVEDDIELLANGEAPEFLDEIEFYRWLEDQRDAG